MRALGARRPGCAPRTRRRRPLPSSRALARAAADEDDAKTSAVDAFCLALAAELSVEARRADEELDAFIARAVSVSSVVDGARVAALARMSAGTTTTTGASTPEQRRAAAAARGDAATMFNAATSAYHRLGRVDDAILMVSEMERAGAAPDAVSYGLLVSALRRAGRGVEANRVLAVAETELRRGTRAGRKKKKVRLDREDLMHLEVLYDDGSIVAVNKPAGVLTHPSEGAGNSATLMDAALSRFEDGLSDFNGPDKRGIVSRLDKPTSGVVLLARDNTAHAELLTQFYQRDVHKSYVALVDGIVQEYRGSVNEPLDDRPATSHFEVLETFIHENWSYTLVRVDPKSGRKHQIRRHMASIGNPLTGDTLYRRGRAKTLNSKPPACVSVALSNGKSGTIFFLHACAVTFTDEVGNRIDVSAPLPSTFESVIQHLRSLSNGKN